MNSNLSTPLPQFDAFTQAAQDDELFTSVFEGSDPISISDEEVFLVAHDMRRPTPQHTHDYIEILYVYSGRVLNIIDDKELYMLPDSAALMLPGTSHSLGVVDEDAVVVNLCLRESLFAEGLGAELRRGDQLVPQMLRGEQHASYLLISDVRGEVLRRSMIALLKEYQHEGEHATVAIKARALLFLAHLSKLDTYSFYGVDRQMMEILDFIERNCAEVSVDSLSRRFGYSPTYFSQYVRKRCGIPARELVASARLRTALKLLVETDLSVSDVAHEVGYRSYSHFHRIFVDAYHITPAAYRRFAQPEMT